MENNGFLRVDGAMWAGRDLKVQAIKTYSDYPGTMSYAQTNGMTGAIANDGRIYVGPSSEENTAFLENMGFVPEDSDFLQKHGSFAGLANGGTLLRGPFDPEPVGDNFIRKFANVMGLDESALVTNAFVVQKQIAAQESTMPKRQF